MSDWTCKTRTSKSRFRFCFLCHLTTNCGLFILKNKIVALHASLIIYSRSYQKEKTTDQLPLLLTNMHRYMHNARSCFLSWSIYLHVFL